MIKLTSFPIAKAKLNKKNIAIAAGVVLLMALIAVYAWLERTDRITDFNLGDYFQRLGAGVATVTQREVAQNNDVSPEDLEITLPAVTSRNYEQTAQAGEGITHLARRAAKEYIDRTGQAADLTSEHKVYIEDYLTKQTGLPAQAGDQWLALGERVSFSEDLIKEAVEKSRQLTDEQLDNLKQYSAQISAF